MPQNTLRDKMFGDSVCKWCTVFFILLALTKDIVEAQDLSKYIVGFYFTSKWLKIYYPFFIGHSPKLGLKCHKVSVNVYKIMFIH